MFVLFLQWDICFHMIRIRDLEDGFSGGRIKRQIDSILWLVIWAWKITRDGPIFFLFVIISLRAFISPNSNIWFVEYSMSCCLAFFYSTRTASALLVSWTHALVLSHSPFLSPTHRHTRRLTRRHTHINTHTHTHTNVYKERERERERERDWWR